ncbi:MAG: hypothetical protein BMS9Abin06_0669 [Gammaproteobacteria bacterium]|nr:MAG: hypothetical protein BMS9Abin06_0669 [Gammaproteobacteria bacterium]
MEWQAIEPGIAGAIAEQQLPESFSVTVRRYYFPLAQRFVQHYERLTRHILREMPTRADRVFSLAPDHSIESVHERAGL